MTTVLVPRHRKHRSQASPLEIQAIEKLVHATRGWYISPHAVSRQKTRVFTWQDILDTLRAGDLIEVNQTPVDTRVVFRFDVDANASCCVCASIIKPLVISVWFNHPTDNHDTIDLTQYRWVVNLQKLAAGRLPAHL